MIKTIIVVISFFIIVKAVEFHVNNDSPNTIWVGNIGNPGYAPLDDGGFALGEYAQRHIIVPQNWSGKLWARTNCDPKTKLCETGNCGRKIQCSGTGPSPPVTLVDIRLKSYGGIDYYGISLLDGFNVVAKIEPLQGKGDCEPSACTLDLNVKCHEQLSVIGANGAIVGCHSSCNRYYSPCCKAKNKVIHNCTAKVWPVKSLDYFKHNCPNAYEYGIEEKTKDFTCSAPIYSITFGGAVTNEELINV